MAVIPELQRVNNAYLPEETPATNEIQTNSYVNKSKLVAKTRKIRAIVIGAIFLVVISLLGLQLWGCHSSLQQIDDQIIRTNVEIKKQKSENKLLSQQINQLNNTNYTEQVIRAKYFYSKPGEVVYNFANLHRNN